MQVKGKKLPTEIFQIDNSYISPPEENFENDIAERNESPTKDLPLHHAPSWETQVMESHKAWMNSSTVRRGDKGFRGENPVETVRHNHISYNPNLMLQILWQDNKSITDCARIISILSKPGHGCSIAHNDCDRATCQDKAALVLASEGPVLVS